MANRGSRKSRFMEKYGRFCDLTLLGALFLATCIPLITAGASVAALYHAITKCFVRDEGYLYKTYMAAWKSNMKQGIALTLISALYAGIGALDIYIVGKLVEAGSLTPAFQYVLPLYFLPLLLVLPWEFLYLSRFNDTVGNILKNSLRIGLSHPWITLLGILILAGCLLIGNTLILAPLLIFISAPLMLLYSKKTDPVLLEIAKNTEGFDPNAWYNR